MSHDEKIITVSVSNATHTTKEDVNYTSLRFIPVQLSLTSLATKIREGYAITHNFFDYSKNYITTKDKTEFLFRYATYVALDLDDCEYNTLSSLLSTITTQPTIAYTTLSHQTTTVDGKYKGNRYRLLYVFNELIYNKVEFQIIYDNLVNELTTQNPDLKFDSAMRSNAQMCLGSTSLDLDNKEVVNNNIVYNNYEYLTTRTSTFISSKKDLVLNSTFEKLDEKDIKIVVENDNFINDYNSNMSNEILLSTYSDKYKWFEKTPLPVVSNTIKKIDLLSNYIEIKRYYNKVYNNVTGHYTITDIIKYRDGEHRKNKLFMNAVLRRYMYPNITLDHLLYCLVYELSNYYINDPKKDYITRTSLKNIVLNSFEINMIGENVTKFINKNKTKTNTWIVNEAYVIANHTTKEAVRNQVKKELNDTLLTENYNPNLSVKENLEQFKINEIKISKSRLYEYINQLKGVTTTKKMKTIVEPEQTTIVEEDTIEYDNCYTSNYDDYDMNYVFNELRTYTHN